MTEDEAVEKLMSGDAEIPISGGVGRPAGFRDFLRDYLAPAMALREAMATAIPVSYGVERCAVCKVMDYTDSDTKQHDPRCALKIFDETYRKGG